VGECVERLTYVVLLFEVWDQWVWKLHSSQCYTVDSAYNNLTKVEDNTYLDNNHVLWLKTVPLEINIFVWCLLLNRVPTKDNLHKW
jgi:hypothetical protein